MYMREENNKCFIMHFDSYKVKTLLSIHKSVLPEYTFWSISNNQITLE